MPNRQGKRAEKKAQKRQEAQYRNSIVAYEYMGDIGHDVQHPKYYPGPNFWQPINRSRADHLENFQGVSDVLCHCGKRIYVDSSGFTRGLCVSCTANRCDLPLYEIEENGVYAKSRVHQCDPRLRIARQAIRHLESKGQGKSTGNLIPDDISDPEILVETFNKIKETVLKNYQGRLNEVGRFNNRD